MRSPQTVFITLFAALALSTLHAPSAHAGWADTLPKHGVIIETGYSERVIATQFSGHGKDEPLADFDMYAPTGEYLGTIVAPARAVTTTWLVKTAVGITDRFTFAVAVPIISERLTRLNLDWTEGDFSNDLGRPYSEDDFWQWANSMGQPTPTDWESDVTLSDIALAGFYNFFKNKNLTFSLLGLVNTRTGEEADVEVLGSYGTTFYELGVAGDLGVHALFDFKFPETLFDRVTLSAEVFYEYFFERKFKASQGIENPLVLNDAPFIGDSYRIKPGDYYGYGIGIDVGLIKGSDRPSWLTRSDPEFQKFLPPLLSVGVSMHNLYSLRAKFHSESEQWDDEQEADGLNKEQRRFTFAGKVTVSLLRYGLPLDIFATYMNQDLIKGKNFRPITGFELGFRIYYSFDAYNPFVTIRDRVLTPIMFWF